MPSGGHARSGKPPEDHSQRSERRAKSGKDGKLILPSQGYNGKVPPISDYFPRATARHKKIWGQLWSTPQAVAWAMEEWRWPMVADLVRLMVKAEDPDAPTSAMTPVRQFRDDLGLSPGGLRYNNWAIDQTELKAKLEAAAARPKPGSGEKPQRRMRSAA